jgi:hypothetical protein
LDARAKCVPRTVLHLPLHLLLKCDFVLANKKVRSAA